MMGLYPVPVITPVSRRCRMITFDDGISLLLVTGTTLQILCDTHLGPDSMTAIRDFFSDEKQLILFNSHADWDHIWGNAAINNTWIIAHDSCLARMHERAEYYLSQCSRMTRGSVTIRYPNLTFSQSMTFHEDGILLLHMPGHTTDSAVCYDQKDLTLYLGDLVEDPIPYIDDPDLDRYIKTLTAILEIPARILVSAHSGIVTRNLIEANIRYIRQIRDGEPVDSLSLGEYRAVHQINLNTLRMFQYEGEARRIQGELFSFSAFWSVVPDLAGIAEEELNARMGEYLRTISNPPAD